MKKTVLPNDNFFRHMAVIKCYLTHFRLMKISPSRFISMKNFKQVMLAIVYLFQILTKDLKQKCQGFF